MRCPGCDRPNVGHVGTHKWEPGMLPEPECKSWPKCLACGESSEPLSGKHYYYDAAEIAIKEVTDFCFTCVHWELVCRKPLELATVIVDNTIYQIGTRKDGPMRGFGGRMFTIQRFDNQKIVTTVDLNCGGGIPEYFRERLPDTARFLPNMPEGFYESTPTQQLCTVALRLENTK